MNKQLVNFGTLPTIVLAAAGLLLFSVASAADETGEFGDSSAAEHLVLINDGGLMYDTWYAQVGKRAPEETHPAYPADAKKKGASTWRCKECHGWDYKGRNGAYSQGSHYTGLPGIRNMTYAPLDGIVSILKDDNHRYGDLMSDENLTIIAHFVSHGQIDMDAYIDRATKKAKGDPGHGERIYQTTCARCHGADGKLINFKTPDKPEFMGTVAAKNPWETLHKIRMGQPGVPMMSMLAFDIQDHVDVLSFLQTLPAK